MELLLILGIIAIIIFVIYRIFVGVFGNWGMTLNSVITQYVALKMLYKNSSDEEIFIKALEARYPYPDKDVGGYRMKMYENSQMVIEDIKRGITGDFKPNLPYLIFFSLFIEGNSVVNKKNDHELFAMIEKEVKKQGFKKYI